jgi:hypothetical protein
MRFGPICGNLNQCLGIWIKMRGLGTICGDLDENGGFRLICDDLGQYGGFE